MCAILLSSNLSRLWAMCCACCNCCCQPKQGCHMHSPADVGNSRTRTSTDMSTCWNSSKTMGMQPSRMLSIKPLRLFVSPSGCAQKTESNRTSTSSGSARVPLDEFAFCAVAASPGRCDGASAFSKYILQPLSCRVPGWWCSRLDPQLWAYPAPAWHARHTNVNLLINTCNFLTAKQFPSAMHAHLYIRTCTMHTYGLIMCLWREDVVRRDLCQL